MIDTAFNAAGDTPDLHRERILAAFYRDFTAKYDAGVSEHGGVLSQKPVLREIKPEVLDLVAYVYSADEQLKRVTALLAKAQAHHDWGMVGRAYAILVTGNERGTR